MELELESKGMEDHNTDYEPSEAPITAPIVGTNGVGFGVPMQ
jgi:hypothetical protein